MATCSAFPCGSATSWAGCFWIGLAVTAGTREVGAVSGAETWTASEVAGVAVGV
jgi:hypothetical protein